MTTCAVDAFYSTNQQSDSCSVECNCSCSDCGLPGGGSYPCDYRGCGGGPFTYHANCTPRQPTMTQQSKLNCCLGSGIPNNRSEGYCGSDYCPGSVSCNSFMSSYCTGFSLNSEACKQFCNSSAAQANGTCDAALTAFCALEGTSSLPVCGCALPVNNINYPGILESDPSLPVQCYNKCGNAQGVIKLSTLDPCQGTFCIMSDITIGLINSNAGNITITQDCGPPGGESEGEGLIGDIKALLKNKWTWIVMGTVILLILLFSVLYFALKNDDGYEIVDGDETDEDAIANASELGPDIDPYGPAGYNADTI